MVGLARVSAFGFPCKTIPAKLVGGGGTSLPASPYQPAPPGNSGPERKAGGGEC